MDFHEEILKLTKLPLEEGFREDFSANDISLVYNEFNKNVSKFQKSQKELVYNIEEINEFVQECREEKESNSEKDENSLVNALVSITDLVEDFYISITSQNNTLMIPYADMIWNSTLKKLSLYGLVRINDEKTKLDVRYNTVVEMGYDVSLPEEYIIRTIKSGYIYKNQVIRKSMVIVNKLN